MLLDMFRGYDVLRCSLSPAVLAAELVLIVLITWVVMETGD